MKIEKSAKNLSIASEIIAACNGDCRPHNPIVTIENGELRLTSNLIPLNEGEIVIMENVESDSFGSLGVEAGDESVVIDMLQTYYDEAKDKADDNCGISIEKVAAEERRAKCEQAAKAIGSSWDGETCVYHDDAMNQDYVCDSEEEMIDLYDLQHNSDPDVRRDAYSHWCAQTTHAVYAEE